MEPKPRILVPIMATASLPVEGRYRTAMDRPYFNTLTL
jgi:hypothetical protein